MLGEIKVDEKYANILKLLGVSISKMFKISCPRVYKISDIQYSQSYYGYPDEETGKSVKPPVWDNIFNNCGSQDLCIIDNGDYIYLYVGSRLEEQLIYDIFGYESFEQLVHYGVSTLEVQMETDAYIRIINIIEQLRSESTDSYQPIEVILENSIKFKELKMYSLIEDSINTNREFSYPDFMSHLHNIIRLS